MSVSCAYYYLQHNTIAKSSELVMSLGGLALGAGLKGGRGLFWLESFEIELTLAVYSKLHTPALIMSDNGITKLTRQRQ